jgi:hypothetical protein
VLYTPKMAPVQEPQRLRRIQTSIDNCKTQMLDKNPREKGLKVGDVTLPKPKYKARLIKNEQANNDYWLYSFELTDISGIVPKATQECLGMAVSYIESAQRYCVMEFGVYPLHRCLDQPPPAVECSDSLDLKKIEEAIRRAERATIKVSTGKDGPRPLTWDPAALCELRRARLIPEDLGADCRNVQKAVRLYVNTITLGTLEPDANKSWLFYIPTTFPDLDRDGRFCDYRDRRH